MGISDLKITIKSILTSSQKSLTPRELLRDFKEIEGYDLPYQKFDYSDIMAFLTCQEMADTVKVNYEGGMPVLVPVASAKSQHIDMLVMKQKSKPKARQRRVPTIRRRAPLPRTAGRSQRYDSRPYSSSTNYQSSSYRPSSYSTSGAYVRQFSTSSSVARSSNQAYSTSKSYSSYPSCSSQSSSYPSSGRPAPARRPLPEGYSHQSSVTRLKTDSSGYSTRAHPTDLPTLKEKLISFMKTRSQGVSENEIETYLLTRSFKDSGIKTSRCLLDCFSDIIMKKDGFFYLKGANYQDYSSQSKEVMEDEAFHELDDGDCSNDDHSEYRTQMNSEASFKKRCNPQAGLDSCGSDSGCYDVLQEKMSVRMRQNFQSLLDSHPNGINLISLANLYRACDFSRSPSVNGPPTVRKQFLLHLGNFTGSHIMKFHGNSHPEISRCSEIIPNTELELIEA